MAPAWAPRPTWAASPCDTLRIQWSLPAGWRAGRARAARARAAAPPPLPGGRDQPPPPWSLTFDLRERETLWSDENKARLVTLFAQYELDVDAATLDARLAEVCALVPGLGLKIHAMRPALLAALLRETAGSLAARLLALKEVFPGADAGALAAAAPEPLLLGDLGALRRGARAAAALLGVDAEGLARLAAADAGFADPEAVGEVLAEMRRLLPRGTRVELELRRDPGWLRRVERGRGRLGDDPD